MCIRDSGGRGQVNIALKVLEILGIEIPVCGMVKDCLLYTSMDVHTSADGELIVMHDENVDRVTDGTGLIKDCLLYTSRCV